MGFCYRLSIWHSINLYYCSIIKKFSLKDQIIFGNYFIALGAFCLAIESAFIIDSSISLQEFYYAIFILFSTHLAYHFHRFFGYNANLKPIDSPRHNWYNENKKTQLIFIILSAIISGICLLKIGIYFTLVLIPILLLSGLYNLKIGAFKGLRHIPILKTPLISMVWAYSLSVPFYFLQPSTPVLFLLARNFLFILAITLPFDIRDLNRDPSWLKTIPQLIGINNTKNLSVFLLFAYLISAWLFNKHAYYLKADFITIIITCLLVYSSKPDQKDSLYLIGLDGSIILRFVLFFTFYLTK